MSAECPVSWLELEMRALGELREPDRLRVDGHLETCARCRDRRDRIVRDQRPMPPLAVPRRRRWVGPSVAGLLLAAVALLVVTAWPDPSPGGVKGDTLALIVVRERGGVVAEDPVDFRPGDRFRVLLTCPPGDEVLDIAVFQGDEVSWPLDGDSPFRCGNRVPIPGAFRLSGDLPVEVCAVSSSGSPSGCVTLVPRTND